MNHSTRERILMHWFLVLVLALVLPAFSLGCSPTGPGVAATVRNLLEQGKIAEALAAAEKAPPGSGPLLARTLHDWAQAREPGAGLKAKSLADLYLASVGLDPTLVSAYQALAALLGENPDLLYPEEGLSAGHAHRCFDLWRASAAARPELLKDGEFVRAGAGLARLARRYEEAARVNLSDVEAQVRAAVSCLGDGRPTAAAVYAERARKLAPQRPDVLCLLAELGQLEPMATTTVMDLALPCPAVDDLHAGAGWALALAYEGGTHDCYVVSTVDGAVRWRLERVGPRSLSLSPSGRYVTYADDLEYGEPCQVMAFDTARAEARVLAGTNGPVYGTAWSPDERMVAVSSFEGLLVVDADGGNRRLLEAAVREGEDVLEVRAFPRWLSANELATQVLYYEGVGPVEVFDPATGGRRQVAVNLPEPGELGNVVWSPDGQWLACWVGQEQHVVCVTSPGAAAAQAVLVTSGVVDSYPLAWSPDGTQLLFRMELPEVGAARHWVWDRASGWISLLPTGAPVWFSTWGDDGVIYYSPADSGRIVGLKPASE